MTTIENPGVPLVAAPHDVTCQLCGNEQPAGFPVALIATYRGRDWHTCAGCAGRIEASA